VTKSAACDHIAYLHSSFTGIFDGLHRVSSINMAGNGISGLPHGVFDHLDPSGAVVDLSCTEITCVPEAPPSVSFILPAGLDPTDKCKLLNGVRQWPSCRNCSFFVNRAGLLSMGGHCEYCMDVDLSYPEITRLPKNPFGVFDSFKNLKHVRLPPELDFRPTRHVAYENIVRKRITFNRAPNTSWVFAGKHWFTNPNVHEKYGLHNVLMG